MFDLAAHIIRQKEFSLNTFGPGRRTKGVCEHIRKEMKEIEADPKDIWEWVDVIILGFDGAWRSGLKLDSIVSGVKELKPGRDVMRMLERAVDAAENGNDYGWIDIINLGCRGAQNVGWPREAIWYAMLAKQIKNEARTWPDWRTQSEDHAIEHVRSE